MYEPEHHFSFEVFDNFSKVAVSVEDLAVRIMYADLDRLLIMFDKRILIFLKKVIVCTYLHKNGIGNHRNLA